MSNLEKERRRLERLRDQWRVTSVNPHAPELPRSQHGIRGMSEAGAKRKAESINRSNPGYQAIAEPMPR